MATKKSSGEKRKFDLTMKEARIGHRESQYEVALMYANGVGVAQDFDQAIHWVQQSAERGFAPAQYLLATRYSAGEVVEQDDHQALKWFLKAAEQNYPKALYKLAKFYSTTHDRAAGSLCEAAAKAGVPKAQFELAIDVKGVGADSGSAKAAFTWCYQAAAQGVASAQCALADRYAQGNGVAVDLDKALSWYRKAARQYHIGAQVALGELDECGHGRGCDSASLRNFSGAAEKRRVSERWSQSGHAGDATAKYQLGLMYQNGWGVKQDTVQSRSWFVVAAQLGHVQAQLKVANILEFEKNYAQALMWYERAAAQNCPAAFVALGRFYWHGMGTEKDDFVGLGWTFKAAELGEPEAINCLGQLFTMDPDRVILAGLKKATETGAADAQYALGQYLESVCVDENDIHAAICSYKNAANQGHALAQCALGVIFSEGKAVPSDTTQARDWFLKSAQQGNAKAQWNLALMLISGAKGIKKDLKQAFVLCQSSALQGFVPAQASLGILYAKMNKPEKAVEWWQVAAKQGDPEAQFNLALALSTGLGVAQDAALATEWLTRAAMQGVASAQSKLALLYATGESVVLDPIEAHKWFVIASQNGDSAAQSNVMHSEAQLTSRQITEAKRRARIWFKGDN